VQELRASTDFTEGIHTPIGLPATATPQEVAGKALTLALNAPITNINVLEIKSVTIAYQYRSGDIPPPGSEYIAVLVDMRSAHKIVLIQYHKDEGVWWNEIYQVNL
jgi:hypothetical protein